ncbi:unnamed protein product [Tetraodon nigroviridis]|uniref:(spotted green pufferfish) hypothetical protein n=1 Tax=Tetraodon nigroviridis TaxID=99883 RepID=Q4RMU6_TETNG|nr:unnamed protein product [Tetraodon nigroviridis]
MQNLLISPSLAAPACADCPTPSPSAWGHGGRLQASRRHLKYSAVVGRSLFPPHGTHFWSWSCSVRAFPAHTHTFLGQRNDYSKANKKRERRGGRGCLTEETGRRGPVRREIGSECVLTAGWGSEWWREGKRRIEFSEDGSSGSGLAATGSVAPGGRWQQMFPGKTLGLLNSSSGGVFVTNIVLNKNRREDGSRQKHKSPLRRRSPPSRQGKRALAAGLILNLSTLRRQHGLRCSKWGGRGLPPSQRHQQQPKLVFKVLT